MTTLLTDVFAMYLLDTDYVGLLQRKAQPHYDRIVARMRQHSLTDFFLPIVAFHEQVMGANLYVSRATDQAGVVRGYRLLEEILVHFEAAQVLAFDDPAARQFESCRKQRLRVGTMDLRIAAIALTHDMTVLTRNLVDFGKVPGLQVEDWTS